MFKVRLLFLDKYWLMLKYSKKLRRGKQMAEKVGDAKKK